MTAIPNRPPVDPEPIAAAEASRVSQAGDLFTSGEFRLTLIIFVFGLVAVGIFYLIQRHDRSTPYTLRIFVIIILVFGTLLVVSSGYGTDQIAPVVGFYGTIAGYLLGRGERQNDQKD